MILIIKLTNEEVRKILVNYLETKFIGEFKLLSMNFDDISSTLDVKHNDLKYVKNTFAEKRTGYQVFPPPDDNINIHEFCLHIWIRLTDDLPLPNFGASGTI